MAGIAPLLLIALRDARRHRARSLLVVAMIALPVAFMIGANVAASTWRITGAAYAAGALGRADAVLLAPVDQATEAAALPLLPAGSRVERTRTLAGALGTGDGPARTAISISDVGPGTLAAGSYRVVRGRLPSAADEVALSVEWAKDAAAIGATVDLQPLGPRRVVGAVERLDARNAGVALVAPGTLPATGPLGPASDAVLADLPPGTGVPDSSAWSTAAMFASQGAQTGRGDHTTIGLAGAIALLEAGLVAAAALAVGARRRLRSQALVAVAGGTPRQLRAGVLAEGVALGLLGVLAGVVVGVAGVLALRGVVLDHADYPAVALRWPLRPLVVGTALGVVAAVLAALGGARAGTRVPLGRALASRRPAAPDGALRLRLALGVLLLGVVATLLLPDTSAAAMDPDTWLVLRATTIVLILVGTGLLAPAALAVVERLARHGRGAARLGIRGVARGRARNVPVLVALVVGVGGIVAVAIDDAGSHARDVVVLPEGDIGSSPVVAIEPAFGLLDGELVGLSPADAAAIGAAIDPAARVARIDEVPVSASALDGAPVLVVMATPEVLELAGIPASSEIQAIGGTDGTAAAAGSVEVATETGARTVPVLAVPSARPIDVQAVVLVPPARLAEVAGAGVAPLPRWIAWSPTPVTRAAAERAQAAAGSRGAVVRAYGGAWVETAPGDDATWSAIVATGIALLGSLLLVGIVVALAAAEGDDEQRALMLVGAGPALRRRIAGAQAWALATLGAVLGTVGGLIAESAYRASLPYGSVAPRAVPWLTVLGILVLVPLAVGLLAALVTRRAPPWRRLALPRG